MKKILGFIIAVVAICFVGCAPMSKESYLEGYKDLVEEAGDVFRSCSDSEWQRLESKYQKYSTEYYQKFESELSAKEKFKILGFEAKFTGYRSIRGIKNAFSGDDSVGTTVGEALGDLKGYVEDDLGDDIEDVAKDIKKGAKSLGKDIEKGAKSLGKDLEDGLEDVSDDVEDIMSDIGDAISDMF